MGHSIEIKHIQVGDFDLGKTLECGQFFRYTRLEHGYLVSHRDQIFWLRQDKDNLFFNGATPEFVRDFFRLDDDYQGIIASISKDDYIKMAVAANHGLRLIRQDPWECLVSYICSANSNIPRITKSLNLISQEFGKRISLGVHSGFAFPGPGEIGEEERLKACKVGFRSRYIHGVNRDVEYNWLLSLRGKQYDTAREELKRLNGVGDKIADCVCLFSLDKLNAFPVDVWIKRVMLERYIKESKVSNQEIRDFAMDYFGKYAGYANQYLFHYRRTQDKG